MFLWCQFLCSALIFLIWVCTSTTQVHPLYIFNFLFRIFDLLLSKQACLSGRGSDILNEWSITEELIAFDEEPVFLIVFGYHWRNSASEGLSIDIPQKGRFHSLDGCRSRGWVKKSELSKSFPSFDASFGYSIDLNRELPFMKNKEWTCHTVLFHQILPFVDFAELELLK